MWFWLSLIALLCWSGSDLFSKIGCQGEDDHLAHLKMVIAVGTVMGLHAAFEIFVGGAGGVESVFTIKALEEQVSPPTINVFEQDPECDIDCCPNEARRMEINYAMKNSFGFGGTNSTVIYKRWTE